MGYKPIRCEEIEKVEMSQEYKKFNEIRKKGQLFHCKIPLSNY